jgi:hypothetical protein
MGQSINIPRMDGHARFDTLQVALTESSSLTRYVVADNNGKIYYSTAGVGGGTVTNVSVATANGLAGSVANPTSTPSITLSTTITGILKGNGTAISAATAGTDYITPTQGTASWALNAINAITASYFSGSVLNAISASYAATASFIPNVVYTTGSQNISGLKTFADKTTFNNHAVLDGTGSNNYTLAFKQPSGTLSFLSSDYTEIGAFGSSQLVFNFGQLPSDYKRFTFNVGNLSLNTPRTFQFPDKTGTLLINDITSGSVATASFAFTSSYTLNAVSASYALNATSASYAATSSNVLGGNVDYIPLWNTNTTLSSSVMYQSSSNVGINTTSPSFKLDIDGSFRSRGFWTDASAVSYWGNGPITASYGILTYDTGYAAVYATSGNNLRLGANGNISHLFISASGNVGIGTTNPTDKLYVSGSVYVKDGIIRIDKTASDTVQLGPSLYLIGGSGASYTQLQQGVGRFTIWGFDGALWNETFTINNTTGNVGIGTTSPSYKLNVSGTIGVSGAATFSNLAGTGSRIVVADASGILSASSLLSNYITGSGVAGQVAYWNGTNSQTGSSNLFWDATNTRLGIGLTNPQRRLEVYSATADSHIRISGDAPSVSMGDSIIGGSYQAKFGLATSNGQYAAAAVAGDFVILSQTGATIFMTSATEKMRVTAAGRMLLGTTTESTYIFDAVGTVRITGNTIISAGSLGIGTTSPARLLHIKAGTGATGAIRVDSDNGNVANILEVPTNGDWAFNTNSQEVMRLSNANGGRVGIGTSSPSSTLTVSGSISGSGAVYFKGITSAIQTNIVGIDTTTGQLYYQTTSSLSVGSASYAATASNVLGGTTNYLARWTSATTLGTGATYDNGTSVGIGTTSPAAKLHVDDGAGAALYVGLSTNIYYRAYEHIWQGINGTTERMRIDPSGNVGIGTTSPGTILDISSSLAIARIRGGGSTNQGAAFYVAKSDGNTLTAFGDSSAIIGGAPNSSSMIWTTTSTPLVFHLNGSERMRITADGNVGIGTTSPSATLQVGTNISDTGSQTVRISRAVGSANTVVEALHIDSGGTSFNQGVAITIGYKSSLYGDYVSRIVNFNDTGVTQATKLQLQTQAAGGTTWNTGILIDNIGNVGIGTTSPSSLLTVAGNISSSAAVYFKGLTTTSQSNIVTIDTTTGQLYYTASSAFGGGGSLTGGSTNYIARWASSTTLTTGSIFDSGSNVGIGTISPTRTLDVAGGELSVRNANDQLLVSGTGGGLVRIYARDFSTFGDISLGFFTGVTERMRITSAGDVGIGTTSPATKLQVNGTFASNALWTDASSVAYWGSYSTAYGGLTWDSGYALVFAAGGNALRLGANGTNTHMTINTSGNVGIGTTSPSEKLSVEGGSITLNNANAAANYYLLLNKKSGQDGGIILRRDASTNDFQIVNRNSTGDLDFYAYGATSTVMSILRSNGNVGIGTTFPGYKLSIQGSAGIEASEEYFYFNSTYSVGNNSRGKIRAVGAGGGSGYGGDLRFSTRASNNVWNEDVLTLSSTGAATFSSSLSVGSYVYSMGRTTTFGYRLPDWQIYNTSSGSLAFNNYTSDFLTISSAGNVGIGTTSPSTLFYVNGYTPSNWIATFNNTGSSGHQMYFGYNDGSTTRYGLFIAGGPGTGVSSFDLAVDGKFYVTSGGNVGIGTTSPANKLHIEGSNEYIRISNSSTGDGGIKISYQNSDTHGLHLTYNPSTAVSYIDNTYPTASGQVYGDIYFRQNVSGTMTNRMIIQARSGNVGINCAGTNARLEVVSTTGEVFRADAASGAYRIVANQTGVNMNGNVGIGTTSPAYKLDVNGAAKLNNLLWFTPTSGFTAIGVSGSNFNIYNGSGAETRVTIDASGNLGLGVTPSAWGASTIGLDIGAWSAFAAVGGSSFIGFNSYSTSTSAFAYKNSGVIALGYQQTTAGHYWQTAPSGTAGNAISFTQAMTLTSGGNLLVGTTVDSGEKLQVSGSATFSSTLGINGVADSVKSGTYTPTLAAVYNVASSGSYVCQYMRVGNVVTVGGAVEFAATAANTWTRISISLPISSTFDFSIRAGGGGAASATNNTCGIQAEAFSGTKVHLDSFPNTTSNLYYTFSFTYLIM